MGSSRIKITTSYPLELHYIKALFLNKQYRRCIALCRDTLQSDASTETSHPLRQSFAQFYLALAHDELARAMHNFSQAKVPASNQAEQFYLDALMSLPASNECAEAVLEPKQDPQDDPFLDRETSSRLGNEYAFRNYGDSPTLPAMRSPPISQHIRNDSLLSRSPPIASPPSVTSDMDDLESHNSFRQIMTPNRMPKLQRDYSSMSLLQPLQDQQKVTEGLMRTIRPGETPRQHHVPPKYSHPNNPYERSRLPRLSTNGMFSSPVRKQLHTVSECASPVDSPVSPVSPLGSEYFGGSDDSTISPISPETPMAGENPAMFDAEKTSPPYLAALDGHLDGMRLQLECHIRLLQHTKQQTLDIQEERDATRTASNNAGRLSALLDVASTKSNSLQQSHSFWSFTPGQERQSERQRRIEAGRERGWARARFDPTKYQELADKALAEL